jgi:ankyrin repeat protein
MDLLLSNNANVNEQDFDGRSSLVWSCYNNQTHAAQWLIDNGADVWLRDSEQCLAIHW